MVPIAQRVWAGGRRAPCGTCACGDALRITLRYDLAEDDFAIVIASDGVWEFLSSQAVADIVAGVKSGRAQHMVDQIVYHSSYTWKVAEGDYRDDITVIVIRLPWCTDAMVANAEAATAEA